MKDKFHFRLRPLTALALAGAPGPSHSGTGDATDLNLESVRDAPGQSP